MADKLTTSDMKAIPAGQTEAEYDEAQKKRAASTQQSAHTSPPRQQQPTPSIPRDVQSAVVREATQSASQSVQRQSGSDTHNVVDRDVRQRSTSPIIEAYRTQEVSDTDVKQLELAVAGEPLHRMRRYLELIQATSVELPNSEPLAALLATVRTALDQLFTVPTQVDDTP